MPSVGTLALNMIMRTQAFERDMRRTRQHISSLDRSFSLITRSVRRFATTIVAAAGIGGFGYMIREQMKAIDATAKMADELDISTRAISGWEHAAKISGTNIEILHKGIQIFVRRLGEAEQGLGEGRRGLEMLGISAQELIDLGTEDAFLRIANEISKADTAARRASLAYQFFGRQGVQLINFFQQGREGIEGLVQEADKLGLTFSRIDAARVEAANDALTRTKAVFTGLFRATTIELAPYIEAAATAFTNWATAGEGVGAKVTDAFEGISKAAIYFSRILDDIRANMLEMTADIATYHRMIQFFVPMKGATLPYLDKETIAAIRDQASELRNVGAERLNAVEQFYENLRRESARQAPSGRPMNQVEMETMMGLRDPGESTVKAIDNIEKVTVAVERSASDRARIMDRMYGQIRHMDKEAYLAKCLLLGQEVEEFRQAKVDELAITSWYQEKKLRLEIEYAKQSSDFVKGMTTAVREMEADRITWGRLGYETTKSTRDGLTDFFYETSKDADSWKDHLVNAADAVGDAMRRLLAQMAAEALLFDVARPILGGLSGLFGSARGNVFEAGRPIPMARGGIVHGPTVFPMAGGTGLMGEAGPEAVMPLRRGPGGRLGVEASGGAAIHVTLKNESGIPLRAEQRQVSPRDVVIGLVLDDFDQGGPMRDLLEGRRG